LLEFKVIDVDILKQFVISACYDEQPASNCNHLHPRQANRGYI